MRRYVARNYVYFIIFCTFIQHEEEASASRKERKISRKENDRRCRMKRKAQKETPKGTCKEVHMNILLLL